MASRGRFNNANRGGQKNYNNNTRGKNNPIDNSNINNNINNNNNSNAAQIIAAEVPIVAQSTQRLRSLVEQKGYDLISMCAIREQLRNEIYGQQPINNSYNMGNFNNNTQQLQSYPPQIQNTVQGMNQMGNPAMMMNQNIYAQGM